MAANDPHARDSPIKTPLQLLTVMVLSLFAPVFGIIMLTQFVLSTVLPAAPSAPLTAEAVAQRIKPVASVAVADAAPAVSAAAAAGGKADGKKVYDGTCTACHAQSVAGSPKMGDKAAWAPRLKTGMAALYASAMKGKGAMPPMGGNAALSEAELKAAVDYITSASK
ncbi:MAG: cytochrome c5 family protein [Betaproteobacteria bacterium]|nr:cytochrome c5 family protein [Betaproteobacteria bacterium]